MGHGPTSGGKNLGIYCMSHGYRKNGYDIISSITTKKNLYKKPSTIKAELKRRGTKPSPNNIKAGSTAHAERYYFVYKNNFKLGRSPYSNQAHHMIPQQVFLNLFDDEERKILKKIKYNINNGKNIIFLPALLKDALFHMLPYHSGSHDTYSEEVEDSADDLSQKLQEYIDDEPCKDKDKIPDSILKQLMDIQTKLWDFLKKSGPVPINTLKA